MVKFKELEQRYALKTVEKFEYEDIERYCHIEFNGESSYKIGHLWYTAHYNTNTIDGESFDFYMSKDLFVD